MVCLLLRKNKMKIIGKLEINTVTDVICDVCLCSTRIASDTLEFATLKAHWGYGSEHDGERYELHLCESCFFNTVSYLKQERSIQNLFSDDDKANCNGEGEKLGLVATDSFFGNNDWAKH